MKGFWIAAAGLLISAVVLIFVLRALSDGEGDDPDPIEPISSDCQPTSHHKADKANARFAEEHLGRNGINGSGLTTEGDGWVIVVMATPGSDVDVAACFMRVPVRSRPGGPFYPMLAG